MSVLHLVRSSEDARALVTARSHAETGRTSLLLLQEAVLARISGFRGRVYACSEHVAVLGKGGPYQEIDYEGIVRLLAEHDRAIVW